MDLKILPIKPSENKKTQRQLHENLPDIVGGSLIALISPVKTGKSTLISNLILNPNFYSDQFDIVYIISNTIHNCKTSRFLKESFPDTCYDHYSDEIIKNILDYQETFPIDKRPRVCIVCDDFIGVKANSMIFLLASRYRHYLNGGLLIFASQLFRALPTIIRANASHVVIGGPLSNNMELEKMTEEYGSLYGGNDNFKKLYKQAVNKRYNFLFLDIQNNPTRAFRNFDELIYTGNDISEMED